MQVDHSAEAVTDGRDDDDGNWNCVFGSIVIMWVNE